MERCDGVEHAAAKRREASTTRLDGRTAGKARRLGGTRNDCNEAARLRNAPVTEDSRDGGGWVKPDNKGISRSTDRQLEIPAGHKQAIIRGFRAFSEYFMRPHDTPQDGRTRIKQQRSVEARVLGSADEKAQLALGGAALDTRRTEERIRKLCRVYQSSIKALCRGCGDLIDAATTAVSIAVGRAATGANAAAALRRAATRASATSVSPTA